MPPIIFIVPGLWEGPQAFKPLQQTLEASGLTVHICALPSTGTTASQGLTVKHDRAAITQDLARVVERAGQDGVVVFLHSAGGFLCCDAMKDLTANAFDAANKKGGVRLIVFMSCALGVEGFETKPTSTMVFSVSVPGLHGTIMKVWLIVYQDGYFTPVDPRNSLFNDMSASEASRWTATLQIQPAGWDGVVRYCGWREVPSVYIVLDNDRAIVREVQEEMAELAGSRVVHLDAGHMAQLTRTSEVARDY